MISPLAQGFPFPLHTPKVPNNSPAGTPLGSPEGSLTPRPGTPRPQGLAHGFVPSSPPRPIAPLRSPKPSPAAPQVGLRPHSVPVVMEDLLMGDLDGSALQALREKIQGHMAAQGDHHAVRVWAQADQAALMLMVAVHPWLAGATVQARLSQPVAAACVSLTGAMRAYLAQWVKTYVGTHEQREETAAWTPEDSQALERLLCGWANEPHASQAAACSLVDALALAPYTWTQFADPAALLEAAVYSAVDGEQALKGLYQGTDTRTYTFLLCTFAPHAEPSLWASLHRMLMARAEETGVHAVDACISPDARALLHCGRSLDTAAARNLAWAQIKACPPNELAAGLHAALAPIIQKRVEALKAGIAQRQQRLLQSVHALHGDGQRAQGCIGEESTLLLANSAQASISHRSYTLYAAALAQAPMGQFKSTIDVLKNVPKHQLAAWQAAQP